MAWIKFDQGFPEHPKVLAAGEEAGWLFVCMVAYCNRNWTDGFVPSRAVRGLTAKRNWRVTCDLLVEVGLLETAKNGYQVHDYLDYQPSRSEGEKRNLDARERMARNRARSREHSANEIVGSREHSAKFAAKFALPVPNRTEPTSSSSSNGSSSGPIPAPVDEAIRIHAAFAARSADTPRAYAHTVAETDRREALGALIDAYNADRSLTGQSLARTVFGLSEVDAHTYGKQITG